VRSRYKRQLIQLNMNKSGLHGLEWKTRDPYSLVDDSLVSRTHCIDPAGVLVSLWNDCSFLGMCNFYRRFVSDYAQVARPLAAMTTFKTPDRLGTFTLRRGLGAFEELKRRLTEALIVALPRRQGAYTLDTDASAGQVGAVLLQEQPDQSTRPVGY